MNREYKRQPENNRPRIERGSRLRIGTILIIGAVAAFALYQSTSKNGPHRPPPPQALGTMSTSKVTDHVADTAVVGGALAAEKAVLGKNRTSLTQEQWVSIRREAANPNSASLRLIGVRSRSPHETSAAAKEDALAEAHQQLKEKLATRDTPILSVPSIADIRDRYVRPESVQEIEPTASDRDAWQAAGLNPNRVWVSLDVVVPEQDLRTLHGETRLWETARWAGIVLVIVAAIFGYLRLDTITRGWASTTLGIIAVCIALVVLGLLAAA